MMFAAGRVVFPAISGFASMASIAINGSNAAIAHPAHVNSGWRDRHKLPNFTGTI